MSSNVVHDEFWTHKNNVTIWDEQIRIPAWSVELTQFASVSTKSNHRLPRSLHQYFKLREGIRIRFASSESPVLGQPANRTKRVRAFHAIAIKRCQIIKVRHG